MLAEQRLSRFSKVQQHGINMNASQPTLPMFKGETYGSYGLWSIKTRTLFKSQVLCYLVEHGYQESDEDQARLRGKKRKIQRFYSSYIRLYMKLF